VIQVGHYENGRPRYKWTTVKGGKREAQRELNRLLAEMQAGAYVEPSRLTLAQYLDRWLADYAKTNVSDKTYEGYEEFVRVHLKPALGRHPLAKLRPVDIQAYYSEKLQNGRRDGKGGLSARTVLHHHRVLREALQQAVKWQLLVRNPADAVEPPRPEGKEMPVLDEAGTATLLQAARGTRLYLPVLLAVTTGMRRGEILGLRWQDVDLKAATLAVRQSLQRTKAGTALKQPKTQKSRRLIALPSVTVDALARHRGEQAEQKRSLGPGYQDRGLVAAAEDGTPFFPNAFSHAFADLVARAGVERVRFHDLRHSHATQLLLHGVHPKIVSERLGHATIGITLDTYSHVLPGMQEEAARKVDRALRAALGE
jgi:integrase